MLDNRLSGIQMTYSFGGFMRPIFSIAIVEIMLKTSNHLVARILLLGLCGTR